MAVQDPDHRRALVRDDDVVARPERDITCGLEDADRLIDVPHLLDVGHHIRPVGVHVEVSRRIGEVHRLPRHLQRGSRLAVQVQAHRPVVVDADPLVR